MKLSVKKLLVTLMLVALSSTTVLAAKGTTKKSTNRSAAKNAGKKTGKIAAKSATPKPLVQQAELDHFFKLCEEGNVEELTKLITEKKVLVNAQGKYTYSDEREEDRLKVSNGMSGLSVATKNSKTEVIELLIKSGANIDLQNEDGITALMWAADEGNLDIVDKLIIAGAKVDMRNKQGSTSLFFAACRGHGAIVERLLSQGADINVQGKGNDTALIYASDSGQYDIVQILLKHNANVDIQNSAGSTALFCAALKGYDQIVSSLLHAKALVNLTNNQGISALGIATINGHLSTVKMLLEAGANIDQKDESAHTALDYASYQGHVTIVSTLLEAGAKDVSTALTIAEDKGNSDIAELLKSAIKVREQYRQNLFAYCKNGEFDKVRVILNSKKTNINEKDTNGNTVLIYAINNNNADYTSEILKLGADVNMPTDSGVTALALATSLGNEKIVTMLLNAGAYVNDYSRGWTALMTAANTNHIAVLKALLNAGANVNLTAKETRWNALMIAAQHGYTEIMNILLQKSADIEAKATSGMTALMVAAANGYAEATKLLIAAGANVDVQENNGFNALMLAIYRKQEAPIPILLAAGTNLEALDNRKLNAYELSLGTNSESIVKHLKNAWLASLQQKYLFCTVKKLLDDLDNNSYVAKEKYLHKQIMISGVLGSIDSDGEYFSLRSQDSSFGSIMCNLNRSQRNKLKLLHKKQFLVVLGKISDVGDFLGYRLTVEDILDSRYLPIDKAIH